ncbi:hypothetical protein R1sor_020756 [Riccia sorocarpa]|uniref:Nudix hydrolase domain-containing protein n=1 Tax=Riccia sorocarpa TaxID=122646 RepID=A0ABD3GIF1_9MARC
MADWHHKNRIGLPIHHGSLSTRDTERKKLERKGDEKSNKALLLSAMTTSSFAVNLNGAASHSSGPTLETSSSTSPFFSFTSKDHLSTSSSPSRRVAEIRGTKSASVKVGLPRAVSLCDIAASGSSLGQVRSSASLPSLLNSVYISSPVTSSRISSGKRSNRRGCEDFERRCYPATEREPLVEEEKAARTSQTEFPSGLSKLSHFLRELARQDCWAGLFEPFQGTGHFNPGNFSNQEWGLRQSSITSTASNMATVTDAEICSAEELLSSTGTTSDGLQSSLCTPETQSQSHDATSSHSFQVTEGDVGTLNGTSSRVNGSASSLRAYEKPQAELCHKSATCVTAEEIGSCENLARWLEERLGSSILSQWGSGAATKKVANLWCELMEGEISLEDSRPPKRTAHVASVKIRNEQGHVLVEAYQQMADGRVRPRNRPLSEKMRPGEHVEEACLRGIYEELGCQMGARERVVIVPESYRREEEERESFSYPGLPTRYVIHTMVAHVEQLPSTEFSTEEDESGHGTAFVQVSNESRGLGSEVAPVGVKRHFWKWVPENELAQVCRRR